MNETERKGLFCERVAVFFLLIKGYRILARRYKTVCGEIDIIARKRDTVVFLEVKSRKNIEKCYNAITKRQLARIQRSSEIFMRRANNLSNCSRRYDVILIADWEWPIHIENVSM
ncbi:MAG: YraN family protein [Holosporaceae bacterium]|jgi:putative endonuclease|nr:YraN family protein [Holosporaceae bacterium]